MKYANIYVQVSNYATDSLNRTLIEYGNMGFKLVNVVMAGCTKPYYSSGMRCGRTFCFLRQ